MQALIDWLFLDLATRSGDVGYIAERAVLAPLNVDSMVDKINDTVAASFYLVKYFTKDSVQLATSVSILLDARDLLGDLVRLESAISHARKESAGAAASPANLLRHAAA